MFDNPATRNVNRAQLLGIAAAAHRSLDPDEPADFWYRQGIRDAHAYAAALLVTGRAGDATQAAADRVVQLLGDGVTDVGVLMEAAEPGPRDSLTWMGKGAFDRLAKNHSGIDHDLGSRWGPRRDIRITHRRPHDAEVGLLYAYDRTWDEYAILHPAAHVDAVIHTFHAAVDVDSHLPLADLVTLLRQHAATVAARPGSPGVQL